MALFTPSQSPAVVVKEIDATGGVPNVQTSTGAIAGAFNWGPGDERVLISNEADLINTFSKPSATNAADFISATNFLQYSNRLYVIRAGIDSAAETSARNAHAAMAMQNWTNQDSTARGINQTVGDYKLAINKTRFDAGKAGFDSSGITFMARYPGALGNAIRVSVCPASIDSSAASGNVLISSISNSYGYNLDSARGIKTWGSADSAPPTYKLLTASTGHAFDNWAYKSSFDGRPGSSDLDSAKGGSNTEMHIAVVDRTGAISGTAGTVLETYPYVSVASNSVKADGSTNYAPNVINELSEYIYMVGWDSSFDRAVGSGAYISKAGAKVGDAMVAGGQQKVYQAGFTKHPNPQMGLSDGYNPINYDLDSGADQGLNSLGDYSDAFDNFEDKEAVEVDFLIAPSMVNSTDQVSIVNDLVSIANSRKDCVVVTSPAKDDVVNVTNETTATNNIVSTTTNLTKSSYLIMDGNWLKVYDKFNDEYIEVPAASSTAGLMAETDRTAAPWFSPAGTRRGQYLGVTSINYNPNKTNRDTLYKAGVNPVVNISGSGICLFGDKTMFNRPSAFDRINVRRLF